MLSLLHLTVLAAVAAVVAAVTEAVAPTTSAAS
jgi:hypothetical protein